MKVHGITEVLEKEEVNVAEIDSISGKQRMLSFFWGAGWCWFYITEDSISSLRMGSESGGQRLLHQGFHFHFFAQRAWD